MPKRDSGRGALYMRNFDTIVRVSSQFQASVKGLREPGVTLDTYMRLPVDQYVCIKMPLDATLTRVEGNLFDLTVPPVRFFNLDVSPTIHCLVTQDSDAVVIESESVVLSGSPYVVGLNGCYNIKIRTAFKWIDTAEKQAILSSSNIYVEVDPPPPFKYFGRRLLESTGTLALSIALRQIENAFVSSLARDYERWARDSQYRIDRAQSCPPLGSCIVPDGDEDEVEVESDNSRLTAPVVPVVVAPTPAPAPVPVPVPVPAPVPVKASAGATKQVRASSSTLTRISPRATTTTTSTTSTSSTTDSVPSIIDVFNVGYSPEEANNDGPTVLTDDICLVPGEPVVRIEEAPANSRRIFTGVDVSATVDDVWSVLVDYEGLDKVIPSLVKNQVVNRLPKGGARLLQVGGAKVLPGVTFTAKILLDVNLYLEDDPLPAERLASHLPETATSQEVRDFDMQLPLVRGVFPRPYGITTLPHRDITMEAVPGEGDFEHYQGIWRMQSLPNCAPDGGDACRLTYAVEIRPKGFLPVRLIEGRIAADLKANLGAIRTTVEDRAAKRARAAERARDAAAAAAARGVNSGPVTTVVGRGGAGGATSSGVGVAGLEVTGTLANADADADSYDAEGPYVDAALGMRSVLAGIESASRTPPPPPAPLPNSSNNNNNNGLPVATTGSTLTGPLSQVDVDSAIKEGTEQVEVVTGDDDFFKFLNPLTWFSSSSSSSSSTSSPSSLSQKLAQENAALKKQIADMSRRRGASAKAARKDERARTERNSAYLLKRVAELEREVAQKGALLDAIGSVVSPKPKPKPSKPQDSSSSSSSSNQD